MLYSKFWEVRSLSWTQKPQGTIILRTCLWHPVIVKNNGDNAWGGARPGGGGEKSRQRKKDLGNGAQSDAHLTH